MRESGFTEVRWYHGQIVRPKLIVFIGLGLFYCFAKQGGQILSSPEDSDFASQNKEAKILCSCKGSRILLRKTRRTYEIRKISR